MNWYVLKTIPGKEEQALELIQRKVDKRLWTKCRILRKQQLFRIHGIYELRRKEMFPGYLFILSGQPEALADFLEKSRDFPQMLGNQGVCITRVENTDLEFLYNACGRTLEHDMSLSTVCVDAQGIICRAEGALRPYVNKIKKQRLNKRFVIAEVPLFNRKENVLFGIRTEGDSL